MDIKMKVQSGEYIPENKNCVNTHLWQTAAFKLELYF